MEINKDIDDIVNIASISMITENHYVFTVKHPLVTIIGVKAIRDSAASPWKLLLEWGRNNAECLRITLSEQFKMELEKPILKLFIPIESSLTRDRERQAIKANIFENERRLEKLVDEIDYLEGRVLPGIKIRMSQLESKRDNLQINLATAQNPDVFSLPKVLKLLENTTKEFHVESSRLTLLAKERDRANEVFKNLQDKLDLLSTREVPDDSCLAAA